MHGKLFFGHLGKPFVQGIRDRVCHLLLIRILIHSQILIGVGHISELDHGCGHFRPVVAGHGIGLPDIFPAGTGLSAVGVQKNVGKTGRCFVEFRMVGIILGDADRHRALGFDIVGTVGMNADEGVCIVFVCDSSALGAADRIEGIMVGHLDLISALLKFSACLLGHIHSQFVFVQTARRTEGTYGIFFLHFGGAGADRLCEAGDLGGVSGIKDNDKSLAHGREGFFL